MIIDQHGNLIDEGPTMDEIQERTKMLIEIVKRRKSVEWQRNELLLEIGRLLDLDTDPRFDELYNGHEPNEQA